MCIYIYICNTFTPQIKGSLCDLNVMYHNHSSPGALQLPSGMHTIVLQLPLVCYNDTRKPLHTS